jgi:CBS domain containing-hemolysin-like protein
VDSEATVLDALRTMGETGHPRIPVYDPKANQYIGAVTFHTMARAISREHIDSKIHDYMIQPARVAAEESLPSVMEKLQDAGTTIAFVFDGQRMTGVITLSDIIEQILGIKV